MRTNFKHIIQNNFLFLKGKKLLITISGGIDSVVLTHLLHQLKFNISLAHCNFHLRGTDSDLDQQFVSKMASVMNIPCFITHFNTKEYAKNHKLSIQEAARKLRYEWFEKVRQENQLDYILTAHNLNDSLETFLINLSRGTGLKGLTGINNINQKIIRPISSFSRAEIIFFAQKNKIDWREDKSNANTKYTRNKIRHQVIPVLQEINPNLLETFKQTLENLQGADDIIQDTILSVQTQFITSPVNDTNKISIKNLNTQIKTNPKAYLHELFSPYGFHNVTDIEQLLTAQSGKQIFSKTHRLIKDREFLLLVENRKEKTVQRIEISENDEKFKIQNSKFKIHHSKLTIQNSKFKTQHSKFNIQIDKDLLKFPLVVRKWQKGDYFYPIGMTGKKKLSKYFKDEKLSLIQKENIWLLLSDTKIVWVIGMRQDNRFKVTKTTKNSTEISIIN